MLGIEDYASDSDEPESQKDISGSSNPPSKAKRAPKKIAIYLPSLPATESAENSEDERPAKKRRTGAGTSSLLSMLPTPKQKSVNLPPVVIGGTKTEILDHRVSAQASKNQDVPPPFKPSSLGKGKRNISLDEINTNQATQLRHSPEATPATDFFALGERFQRFTYEISLILLQVMPREL